MGGSIGATISKEIDDRFHLNKGDEVFVCEKGAKRYRNALRKLAE